MDVLLSIFSIAGGFLLLVYGANWLVSGASAIAHKFGISPMVIGLTVVAFGTSMPEFAVNVFSAVRGSTEIAIGNIVGSNIANILLILGISSLIYPLTVKRDTAKKEIPAAFAIMVLLFIFASDGAVALLDGLVLLIFFVAFLWYTYRLAQAGEGAVSGEEARSQTFKRSFAQLAAGLGMLVLGGMATVHGAVDIATILGVSERVIGLTIVAIGTSLPELFTSAVAAYRKQADIAIGNVVGSNIFNVLWILGATSLIKPLPFSSQNTFDVIIACIATALLFMAVLVGRRHLLERWQGGLFVVAYVVYLVGLLFFQTA